MSIKTFLAAVGKDLTHLKPLFEEGLRIAATVTTIVDPPLGLILTQVETILESASTISTTTLTEEKIQQIFNAVTVIETILANKATALAPKV